jgi:hypothetical protein
MEFPMQGKINRRELLRAAAALGGTALLAGLAGCQKQNKRWAPLSEADLKGPPTRPLSSGGRYAPEPLPTAPAGVIPRREWTSAGMILSLANPMRGIQRITVHHSALASGHLRTKADTARMLESIRRIHLQQEWADIGYHYIIDPAGRIWEGRPVQYQGAHVKLNNEHNLGVMLLGNFEDERPSAAALTALDEFIADRMRALRIPVSRIYTHQELSPTACPGRHLQGYMVSTRSGSGRMSRA